MWKSIHLGLVAMLTLSFAQAPFQHIHDDDPGHEHAGGFSHAHFMDDHGDHEGTTIESRPDADARLEEWLAGDGSSTIKFVPDLPLSVVQPRPSAQASAYPEFTARSHDPPWRVSLHPRAPPA